MAEPGVVSSSPATAAATLPPSAMDHGATGDKKPQPKPTSSKKRAATAKPTKKNSASQVGEHPKYSAMIKDAISKLKERGGSSRQAILKFLMAQYKLGSETNKINSRVKLALKTGVKTGSFKQSKGTGAAGSFQNNDKRGSGSAETGKNKPRSRTTKAVRKPVAVTKSPKKKTAAAAKKTNTKSPKKASSSAKKGAKTAKLTPAKPKKSPAKKAKLTPAKPKKSPAKKAPQKKAAGKKTARK